MITPSAPPTTRNRPLRRAAHAHIKAVQAAEVQLGRLAHRQLQHLYGALLDLHRRFATTLILYPDAQHRRSGALPTGEITVPRFSKVLASST